MLFSEVLLEQGIDVELPLEIEQILDILDEEIPGIKIEGKQYAIDTVNRASFGKEWEIVVKVSERNLADIQVAMINLTIQEDGNVLFTVPPRINELDFERDPKGALYGRMIFSLLNVFQTRGFLDLPGRLPIE